MSGQTVQSAELQRHHIVENKVTASVVVHRLDLVVYTIKIGSEVGAWHLRIGDECINAEIVGADPEGIDRLVGGNVEEVFTIDLVLLVGKVCWHLILRDGGKVLVNGIQNARSNVVGANSARDGVVVQVGPSVLLDVFYPGAASIWGIVVL